MTAGAECAVPDLCERVGHSVVLGVDLLNGPITPLRDMMTVLAAEDSTGTALGAPGPIRRALNQIEPYRQKRLLLNLMVATRVRPRTAIPLVGGAIEAGQPDHARSALAYSHPRDAVDLFFQSGTHSDCTRFTGLTEVRQRASPWRRDEAARRLAPDGRARS